MKRRRERTRSYAAIGKRKAWAGELLLLLLLLLYGCFCSSSSAGAYEEHTCTDLEKAQQTQQQLEA
jgi:hypothetical protein